MICDVDEFIRATTRPEPAEPIPPMTPARPRRALPRRPGASRPR